MSPKGAILQTVIYTLCTSLACQQTLLRNEEDGPFLRYSAGHYVKLKNIHIVELETLNDRGESVKNALSTGLNCKAFPFKALKPSKFLTKAELVHIFKLTISAPSQHPNKLAPILLMWLCKLFNKTSGF